MDAKEAIDQRIQELTESLNELDIVWVSVVKVIIKELEMLKKNIN